MNVVFPFSRITLLKLFLGIVMILVSGKTTVGFLKPEHKMESLPEKSSVIFTEDREYADSLINSLNRKGYLQASIDSIYTENGQQKISFKKGQKFYYEPDISNIPPSVGNFTPDEIQTPSVISFEQFNKLTRSILHSYANAGYPFARINKQNIVLKDSVIHLDLEVNPMEYTEFQDIKIKTDIKISKRFLHQYFGINKGDPYNEEKVRDISAKIESLDFLALEAPVEISFFPGQAVLSLPLKKTSNNRFDGIAGLSGGGNNEPLRVNGILNLYLSNTLERGESIDIRWRAPGNTTQFLDIVTKLPYPLGIPVETGFGFSLQKQDTSWIQIQTKPSLKFNIRRNTFGGIFLDYTNNSLLAQTTGNTSVSEELTSNVGFTSLLYGITFEFTTPGFHTNLLRKGLSLELSGSAGNIRFAEDTNSDSNQNHEQASSLHMKNSMIFNQRWRLSNRSTLSLKSDFFLMPGKNFHNNQLQRTGGFQSLRGFDDLSLMASGYIFNHLDLRYFTSPESFFSLFINGGWYENKNRLDYYNDYPVGFGLGIHQQTQAGTFTLYFASGFSERQNFSLRNAKVHAGYISKF